MKRKKIHKQNDIIYVTDHIITSSGRWSARLIISLSPSLWFRFILRIIHHWTVWTRRSVPISIFFVINISSPFKISSWLDLRISHKVCWISRSFLTMLHVNCHTSSVLTFFIIFPTPSSVPFVIARAIFNCNPEQSLVISFNNIKVSKNYWPGPAVIVFFLWHALYPEIHLQLHSRIYRYPRSFFDGSTGFIIHNLLLSYPHWKADNPLAKQTTTGSNERRKVRWYVGTRHSCVSVTPSQDCWRPPPLQNL